MQANNKDSIPNTIAVALGLCLVCSLLVSLAAVGLKPFQTKNIELDRKKNLLEVTGFSAAEIAAGGGIESLFEKRFDTQVIDLETGKPALDELKVALKAAGKLIPDDQVKTQYDQFWASKSKKESVADPIPRSEDVANVKYREKFSHVFVLLAEDGKTPEKYIFPVRGYGLWSMMQGYLALQPDFQTVAGLTFYDQKETPGLGGEVVNPIWKSYWDGKKVYDPETQDVKLSVIKGAVDPDNPNVDYQIDGLSGATITANGVSNMLEYWMGPAGFGNYIAVQKGQTPPSKEPAGETTKAESKTSANDVNQSQTIDNLRGNHG